MNLNHLQYFVKLAYLEHYTKAAKDLSITQPSLSHAISSLEEELGTKLFEKQGRNVSLTKYGKTFLKYVEKSLEYLQEGVDKTKALTCATSGLIDLGYIYTLEADFMPNMVRKFLDENKDKNFGFTFSSNNTKSIIEGLKNEKYDLGFCSKVENETSIDFIKVKQEELVIIVPKNHELSKYNEIDLIETISYNHIVFTKSSGLRQVIDNLDEIKSAIKTKKGLLYKFMVVTEAPLEEFIKAIESNDENERNKCINSIKEKVKYNIQKEFNYFYEEDENVKIKVNFENNCLKIFIKTKEHTTYLDERSNGLKWFLNLFIDLAYGNLENKTIIYLLDEPGVYLHVNAQRELLVLLKNLCNKGGQVVYTTHSPYMIDTEDIINVRAIEKDENGVTHIFNNAYDNKFNSSSKRETLTPLLKAIGADIKYNLGPRLDKVNIVTEGITDYMYFTAMLDYLGVEEEQRPYILPSVGAGNVNALVSILIGWGCNYKVVLDYDKAGVIECNKLIDSLNLRLNHEVFFINCKDKPLEKEYIRNPEFVESLISEEDKNKLSVRYEVNKTMAAKEFYDKVIDKEIVLSDETINNFRRLFVNLSIIE